MAPICRWNFTIIPFMLQYLFYLIQHNREDLMSKLSLQEMKDLRSQNWDLEYIEQHFLAKVLLVNQLKDDFRWIVSCNGETRSIYKLALINH